MTLKSLLNVFSDTRYRITALDKVTGEYETIELDYLNADREEFSKALATREAWMKRRTAIYDIRYNKAAGCNEIRVDLLSDRR